jgi:hypothetical protein
MDERIEALLEAEKVGRLNDRERRFSQIFENPA